MVYGFVFTLLKAAQLDLVTTEAAVALGAPNAIHLKGYGTNNVQTMLECTHTPYLNVLVLTLTQTCINEVSSIRVIVVLPVL